MNLFVNKVNIKILIVCLFFTFFYINNSFSISHSEEKKLRILYYNSETPQGFWWRTSSEIMQAACLNLGMELNVVYVNRDSFMMVKDFKKKASSSERPDAVVFQNLHGNAIKMLTIAEDNKIPAFIFNAGLTDAQIVQYGKPREHFKYWIGQIFPDDKRAGYELALQLFHEAVRRGLTDENGNVHFLGITGTKTDTASIEREKGLRLAAKEEHKIILDEVNSSNWERIQAQKDFNWLILRHPKSAVVWAANDPMALGVLDSIENGKLSFRKNVLIGSMDWVPEALQQVKSGKILTSLDGHFMETAWAAILIYDYFHQNDFSSESTSFHSKMTSLSSNNINDYLKYFQPENFNKINFSLFSKEKNKNLKQYDFNFDIILKQLVSK